MTQKEKELLLRDLCARLPYGVKVYGNYRYSSGDEIVDDERVEVLNLSTLDWFINGIELKPYLRPMSSMTEEEKKEFDNFYVIDEDVWMNKGIKGYINQSIIMSNGIDWLNSHHFDYRGLISKGLALPSPEGMYNTK